MGTHTTPAPGQILTGPLFSEPVRVETVQPNGPESWVVGVVGTQSERFRRVALSPEDLSRLSIVHHEFSFDGDGRLLRLGLQAYALGNAYEFDPYFGLSISRVDPLPHQLEAVYDYLLKLARVRFLLADDAGAGKTIKILPKLRAGAELTVGVEFAVSVPAGNAEGLAGELRQILEELGLGGAVGVEQE